MLACLNRSGMIPVFPKCSLERFPSVEFLGRFSRDQLKTLRNHFPVPVNNKQVDMIGRDGIVENIQPVALLRLEQPMSPSFAVPRKLEQKLLLMTPVCDVPNLSWDVMTISSRHLLCP